MAATATSSQSAVIVLGRQRGAAVACTWSQISDRGVDSISTGRRRRALRFPALRCDASRSGSAFAARPSFQQFPNSNSFTFSFAMNFAGPQSRPGPRPFFSRPLWLSADLSATSG